MNTKIPFEQFSENGPVLHFAHANGFPPNCYRPLLKGLSKKYKVLAMHQRPLWKNANPNKFKTWHVLANDLISFFEENNLRNIIGVGHSMGGIATAIAAAKRPELFSHIILIDPVLFSNKYHYIKNLMPIWLRKKKFPIAKIALKRKDHWPSKEIVYESLRNKKIFSLIPDKYFPDFINGILHENQDGSVSLMYPKAWETQIYCTPSSAWKYLAKLNQPTLAIKADGTNLLFPPIWNKWKRIQPTAEFQIISQSSHLVPLEKPEEVEELVMDFLKRNQISN